MEDGGSLIDEILTHLCWLTVPLASAIRNWPREMSRWLSWTKYAAISRWYPEISCCMHASGTDSCTSITLGHSIASENERSSATGARCAMRPEKRTTTSSGWNLILIMSWLLSAFISSDSRSPIKLYACACSPISGAVVVG